MKTSFERANLDLDKLYEGVHDDYFLVDWRQSLSDDWHTCGTLEHQGDLAIDPDGIEYFMVWDDETQGNPMYLVPLDSNYIRNAVYKG